MNANFNKYLWNIKLDVSRYTEGDSHYIKMREPNIAEFKEIVKIQKMLDSEDADESENVMDALEKFCDISRTLIVDHDFYSEGEEPQKLPSKEVSEFLTSKMTLSKFVLGEYLMNLPLATETA